MRGLLVLRLCDLAGRLHVREALAEDERLERLEFASAAERARLAGSRGADDGGWFALGRAPSESGTRARLEAETHWFGASSLAEVAAVHSGEGYRIHERGDGDELVSLGSQAPLVRGFQAELRLAVGEEERRGEPALVEELRAALASKEWAEAAETLVAIERLKAFAPAADITAWLRSPAAPLGRTEALRIRRVVGVYSRGGIAPGELTGLSLQKLDCLVPAIRQGLLATEEALALARSEPIRALQAKARLLRRQA